MKDSTKTSITVSIDLADDFERGLFEYVMSKGPRKKSGFIKRLIHADKVGLAMREITTTSHQVPVMEPAHQDEALGFF